MTPTRKVAEIMAERSNAAPKKSKDAAQDVSTLQKRGRRRLVGAIALVLLAVIILPMIFDPEPKQNTSTVNIRIPSEEGTPFTPKVAPRPGAQPEARKLDKSPEPVAAAKPESVTPVVPPTTAAPSPAPVPAPVVEPVKPAEKPAAKVEEKPAAKAPEAKPAAKKAPPPEPKVVEKKAAPAPVTPGEKLIVQVGAFGSPDKVKEVTEQLKGAKLAHFTESIATAKGPVTRVRLGPFSSRESAEKARDRAKALGLNPANPVVVAPAAKPAAK